ncbi:MAG: hypothetical protein KDC92_13100 [Bacteroidetes bacterium]|nr:hypothetical protein [Bacteroidota bacterium]
MLSKLIKSFFQNDYFISMCSGAWLMATASLFTPEIDEVVLLLGLLYFCSTLIIYNFDRLFGDNWNELKQFIKTPKWKLLPQKARANLRFQPLFLALLFWALFQVPKSFILSLIPAFLVAFFYAIPVLGVNKRPRDVPFLKIFLIAFVWSWITTMPFGEFGNWETNCWSMFGSRFCFIFAITVPFDLRDTDFDQSQNTKTLAHILGTKWAVGISILSLICGMGLNYLGKAPDHIAHVFTSLVALVIVVFWNKNRPYYYYLFFLDGCILLHAILIWFLN